MWIIDDFVLIVLFTTLFRFLIQIADTFLGSLSYRASINLNNCFDNSLLNASTKTVWVYLYLVVALLYLCNINRCLHVLAHVPFKDIMEQLRQIKLMVVICHFVMREIYFFRWRCMNLSKRLICYHELKSFFGINVILCSSLIVLLPAQM